MVCLHCNLSLSRAEVGIIGEPPVRIRVTVGTACLSTTSITVSATLADGNPNKINKKGGGGGGGEEDVTGRGQFAL